MWVFRGGSEPFPTNPRNIGAERFFYADPDRSSVEADLAGRETLLSTVVGEIRRSCSLPAGSEALLAELVGQLMFRSKNLREGFAIAAEATVRDAFDTVMARKSLRREARKALIREAEKLGMEIPAAALEQMARSSESDLERFLASVGGLTGLLETVDLPKTVKRAQVTALEERLHSVGERLNSLCWRPLITRDCTLVLGDVGPVALARTKKAAKPGAMFSSKHDLIVLPLSDSVALVGGVDDFGVEEVNVERLNAAAARLSSEFLVARANRPQERHLHRILGKDFRVWQEVPRGVSGRQRERPGRVD